MSRTSRIPHGVIIRGSVRGSGDLKVAGRIEGDIELDGAVLIEADGAVRGGIVAKHVCIAGALVGDARGRDGVEVRATGKVVGDLAGAHVSVDDGAKVSGGVTVTEGALAVRAGVEAARRTATGMRAPVLDDLPPLPEAPAAVPAANDVVEAAPQTRARPRMPRVGRARASTSDRR